jgi:hypothetical protein
VRDTLGIGRQVGAGHTTINRPQGQKENEIVAAKKKGKYVIVRTYSAGVFAGNLVSRKGQEVVMADARRLWYWRGAATLSQLATDGTMEPDGCKFPTPIARVELLQVIEILDVTAKAEASIKAVPVWKQ